MNPEQNKRHEAAIDSIRASLSSGCSCVFSYGPNGSSLLIGYIRTNHGKVEVITDSSGPSVYDHDGQVFWTHRAVTRYFKGETE